MVAPLTLFLAVPVAAGTVPEFTPLAPISHLVGEEAGVQAIALGDVDLDGIVDMVAIDEPSDQVVLFIGKGDGTFADALPIGSADLPTAVAIGDLTSPFDSDTAGDIDGNPDVVVVDDFGALQIFIGLGDGTFDPPDQSFDDLDTVEIAAVAIADFNEDGRDDLAILESFDGVYFLCNSLGTLESCPTPVVFLDQFSFELVDIAVGDFNGGGLDVAAVDVDTGELYPIFGNGDGTFDEEVVPIAIGGLAVEPRAVRVGRLNGDDLDDLTVLSFDFDSAGSTLSVFNGSDGSTTLTRADYPAGGEGNALVLADFDGDHRPDAVVVGQEDLGTGGDSVFLKGNAEAGFDAPLSSGLEALAGGRVLQGADLNDSGMLDLVGAVSGGSQIQVMLNRGPGAASCVGDCNDDGAVAINELITGVNIALGNLDAAACTAIDADGDGVVAINELVRAVNNALDGCLV